MPLEKIINLDFNLAINVLVFIVFFLPGFISLKIYDLLEPNERRDFSKSLFEVVAYSSLNFFVLFYPIFKLYEYLKATKGIGDLELYTLILVIVFVISPILWPIIIFKVSRCKLLVKHIIHPTKKPWDFVFGKRNDYWVIVNLKDGKRIGGIYSTNSFTSSFPYEEEIYLEKVWALSEDGAFEKEIENSHGVLVLSGCIHSIEFLKN